LWTSEPNFTKWVNGSLANQYADIVTKENIASMM
jgi:hypothetical protein